MRYSAKMSLKLFAHNHVYYYFQMRMNCSFRFENEMMSVSHWKRWLKKDSLSILNKKMLSVLFLLLAITAAGIVPLDASPATATDKQGDKNVQLSDKQHLSNDQQKKYVDKKLGILRYKRGIVDTTINGKRLTDDQLPNRINNSLSTTRDAPKYMLDIFRRFTTNPFNKPASNIIRSFFNEATDVDQRNFQRQDTCTFNRTINACPRRHLLSFDISSIPQHEQIIMAELRLYKIVEMDRLLDSKRIIGRASGWETFYITGALRRWVNDMAKKHQLEVLIENISEVAFDETVEFEEHPKTTHEPLLIVFSGEKKRLQQNMLSSSDPVMFTDDNSLHAWDVIQSRKKRSAKNTIILENTKRTRRSPGRDCHLERMEVKFKDIGYTWVVNPISYPAGKCVGECSVPLQGQNFTRHAIIQTLMNRISPKKHNQPCCVPVKLGSISILYLESNTVTFNFKYEGMKVLACGCR